MTADTYQVGGAHYKKMSVSPWQVIDGWPRDQRIGFYRGNTVKYALRLDAGKSDMLEEAEKMLHYAQKLVEVLREGQEPSGPCEPTLFGASASWSPPPFPTAVVERR
jgi:hypothetical protein